MCKAACASEEWLYIVKYFIKMMKTEERAVSNCHKAWSSEQSCSYLYLIWWKDRREYESPVWSEHNRHSRFLSGPGWARLDWGWTESEEFSTSGLYLQLTLIWMPSIVSSRSTKTELFGVWALSVLHSEGVELWRLTSTAGPVCQAFMRFPQPET